MALINKNSIVTISKSRTNLREMISRSLQEESLADLSLHARVTYLFLRQLLESYEQLTEHFEAKTEQLEEKTPPWPRKFYSDTFMIKKEANRLLRLSKHLSPMIEALSSVSPYTKFTNEERMIFDGLYERALGVEEMMDATLANMRDLVSMHVDAVSYGMNRGMRLLSAVTVIVGVATVVAALFGMSLIDIPQLPLHFWQVVLIDLILSLTLIAFFYSKGWLIEK